MGPFGTSGGTEVRRRHVMDRLTSAQRSKLMRRVKGKNTRPEKAVRSVLHRLGFRFRLHRKDLPGRPDIVLPKYRAVVFVHGCYWHRHGGCRRTTTPSARRAFWEEKFSANVERDRRNREALIGAGWRVLVVWECETVGPSELAKLTARLRTELTAGRSCSEEPHPQRGAANPRGV